MTRALLPLTLAVLIACNSPGRESLAQGTQTARAELVNAAGERIGAADLRQGPHGVHVQLQLENAPPGTRALHVHETGRCEPTFEAAGSHWNPAGRQHGFLNAAGPHRGDMPNLHVPGDGRLAADFFLRDVQLSGDGGGLLDGDGAALVMHEQGDDHRTDPSGSSGDRIACGVIRG